MSFRRFALAWAAALALAVASDCGGKPAVEQCFVAGDEDGNGLADCADPACWKPNGGCKEVCSGGHDEDADGLVDCEDDDCWVKDGVCKEKCTGGKDEDGDGAIDCADSDCWVKGSGCKEVCSGGKDEDGNGLVDCLDPVCWVKGGACKEVCSGGNDEDADGLVDCADPDCVSDKNCIPGFDKNAKPIFLAHCAGMVCHNEATGAGGMIVSHYDDMLKQALYCPGETKGWCTVYRIKEGSMPKDCPGCVSQKEIDVLQAWVDGGLLP